MTVSVEYAGFSGGNRPSPKIWGDCPWRQIAIGQRAGVILHDDFTNLSQHITDQVVQQYASYIDTGVTITQLAGVVGGQAEIAGNDVDNDEGVLATHGPIVEVNDTVGSKFKMWFEARVSKASIADNALAMFIGLAFDHGSGVSVAQTGCLTDDDGALGAFSFLGFHVDQANGDAIDFVYKAEGQSAVVVKAGIQVPVINTFYKLGMKYDPEKPGSKQIALFVDGVRNGTYVTSTQIAAVTFPDAEPLGLAWCTKVGTNAAIVKAQLDWWRVAQVR